MSLPARLIALKRTCSPGFMSKTIVFHTSVLLTRSVTAWCDVAIHRIAEHQVAQALIVPGDDQLPLAEVALVVRVMVTADGSIRSRVPSTRCRPFSCAAGRGFDERLHRDCLHADLGEKRVVIGRLLSFSRAHDFATTHPVGLCAWYEQVIETHLRRARRQRQTWICRM